jgi:TonB family protein
VFSQEERRERTFPLERAVLISLALHVVLFFFLVLSPPSQPTDPRKGLLAALVPEEEQQVRIPVQFMEAPGPARENPRGAAASDLDRRASGGDPSRSKSSTPYVAPTEGMAGLMPGERSPREPASRPAEAAEEGSETSEGGERPYLDERASESALLRERGGEDRGPGRLAGLDQAIREAAQGAGEGGEGGAGFPNPDGGFVDSGPLSFDTTWYDWGPYAAEMVRRIKLHWEIPSLARLGWKGKLTIRFFILADGRVEGATIISRSGVPPFDFAALQAILKSSPFRPLPADLGSQREGVNVTFFYNMHPTRSGEPEPTR